MRTVNESKEERMIRREHMEGLWIKRKIQMERYEHDQLNHSNSSQG